MSGPALYRGPRGRQRPIDATQEITETKKERCGACLGGEMENMGVFWRYGGKIRSPVTPGCSTNSDKFDKSSQRKQRNQNQKAPEYRVSQKFFKHHFSGHFGAMLFLGMAPSLAFVYPKGLVVPTLLDLYILEPLATSFSGSTFLVFQNVPSLWG